MSNTELIQVVVTPTFFRFRYTRRVNGVKLYVEEFKRGFCNSPLNSVITKENTQRDKFYTYNDYSGIYPKFNLDFLNKVAPEAVVIFSASIESRNSQTVVVGNNIK